MFARHLVISVALSWSASAYSTAPTAHASQRPRSFQDCAGCPEMVVIRAGKYTMGSAATDVTADALEQPSHVVHVRSFAAAKFDVSLSEWRAFVRATNRLTALGCQWTGKAAPSADQASLHIQCLDMLQTQQETRRWLADSFYLVACQAAVSHYQWYTSPRSAAGQQQAMVLASMSGGAASALWPAWWDSPVTDGQPLSQAPGTMKLCWQAAYQRLCKWQR